MKNTKSLKDASQLFCPNEDCPARGKIGAGHIVSHGKERERYKCKMCKKTFGAYQGTMFEGLRKPEELIVIVVTLLAYGCPPQAIVHALHLDERTVARWQERAGAHCQKVHSDQVVQAKLDLQHVQADEIRGKGCKMIPWMAMAIMVSTRLWLGGVVSLRRDRQLADQLLRMVKACCRPRQTLLVLTDGWSAYPNSIRRAFREKLPKAGGRGRCGLQAWPDILIGTVIKKTAKKHVVEVIRRMAQGTLERANEMLVNTLGGKELNTAYIERFNGTMRERLASLTRRCRHAARRVSRLEAGMWLVGCTYNWCWPHHELSRRLAKDQGSKGDVLITPAMASGLTDRIWSVREVLAYRIAPPPWIAPKRRGRPKRTGQLASSPSPAQSRPLLRLRKGILCSSTS
jgi:transposase-like protein/IS1 family transposase